MQVFTHVFQASTIAVLFPHIPCCSLPVMISTQHPYPHVMSLRFYSLGAALVAVAVFRLRKIGRRPAGYLQGPPTLPLIGNLRLMPKQKAHLQFQKWAQEYGPVYSLVLGTKVMIVLSSGQAVKDLLDK